MWVSVNYIYSAVTINWEADSLLLYSYCFVGLYSEYGYENRLTMLENEFPGANIILHKMSKLPQASFLWTKATTATAASAVSVRYYH